MNFFKIILIIQLFLSFSYGYTKQEVEKWRKIGIYHFVEDWKNLGFNFEKAKKWCLDKEECSIVRVKEWHEVGIHSAKEMSAWKKTISNDNIINDIKAWRNFGVNSPLIAREWCKISRDGIGYNLEPSLEYFKEYGFTNLEIAKKWYDKGFYPHDAIMWIRNDIEDSAEASQWAKIGIKESEASAYREMDIGYKDVIKWRKKNFTYWPLIKKFINIGINSPAIAQKWQNNGFNFKAISAYKKQNITNPEEAKMWDKIVSNNIKSIAIYKKYGISTPKLAEQWKNSFIFIYNNFEEKYVKKIMKIVYDECDGFNGSKNCLLFEGFKNNFKSINDKLWISSGSEDILIKFDGGFFSSDVPEDYLIEDNGYNKIYMIVYKSGSDTVINRFTNTKRKIVVYSPVFHQLQLK